MKPISPKEVKNNFEIPSKATSILNNLILRHWTGTEAIVYKEDLTVILSNSGYNNSNIISILVKIPNLYKQYGWDVVEVNNTFVFTEIK